MRLSRLSVTLIRLRVYKLLFILSRRYWRRALIKEGVGAAVEHRFLKSFYIDTLVDIGANRGQFSLALRPFVSGQVYAFEPIPCVVDKLRRVFSSDCSVEIFDLAVANDKGECVLELSASDDSSSLLPISDEQHRLYPGTYKVGEVKVKTVRLDDILSPDDISGVALLKVDVQGAELQTLNGCASLLPSFDYVYCECSMRELYEGQALAGEIIAFLWNQGFHLTDIRNVSRIDGDFVQADFLFEKIKR